ncbi:MAG: CHAT domain-containing protein [Acidobacteriota bacterium]
MVGWLVLAVAASSVVSRPAAAEAEAPSAVDALASCDAHAAGGRERLICLFRASRSGPEARRLYLTRLAAEPSSRWTRYFRALLTYGSDRAGTIAAILDLLPEFRAADDLEGVVSCHIVLARLELARGRFDQAEQRERQLASFLGERCPEAGSTDVPCLRLDLLRAERQFRLGEDLRGVQETCERIRAVAPRTGLDRDVYRTSLSVLAKALGEMGRYAAAQGVLRELADWAREHGALSTEARSLYDQVVFRVLQGEIGDLEAKLARIVELAEATGSVGLEMLAWNELGRLRGKEDGRADFERCLELAADRPRTEALYCRSSLLAARAGEASTAEVEALLAGQRGSVRLNMLEDALEVVWEEPRMGGLEDALTKSQAYLQEIEELRRQQQSRGSRAEVFAVWRRLYATVSGRLLAQATSELEPSAAVEEAFVLAERVRARNLLELLGPVARRQDDSWEALIPDLRQVQARMAPDEALLTFQMARDRYANGSFAGGSWALVLRPKSVEIFRLPSGDEVEDQVRMFLNLFERNLPADPLLPRPLSALTESLFAGPIAALPPEVTKLTIVPDGNLHRFPFALVELGDGRSITERFSLSVVPSATLWFEQRQTRARAEPPFATPALVFADPVPLQVADLSDEPVQVERLERVLARKDLGPLPHARREGREIVCVLGGGSRAWMGAEATEGRLKQTPPSDFQILHFATHAMTDRDQPERSAVLLTSGTGDDDGRLSIPEIVDLDLDQHMVVLSACRGATGRILQGEGPLGLARAFFEAGARVVIGSYWSLQDAHAEYFFTSFYRELVQGVSVAQALGKTQDALRREGLPVEAWAGIMVLGDGEFVPFEQPPARRWWACHQRSIMITILLFVLLLAYLLGRRWLR